MSGAAEEPLLRVRDLKKHYPITEGILRTEVGRVRAVDGISFDLYRGETLGIVGESGCGKSTTATTLLRLEEPTAGSIVFDGDDVAEYDADELKRFRRRAQMIFQDPESSFDPRMSAGESVAEPLLVQGMRDRGRRRRIVENLLERVGLAAEDADRYPHEFSGGQKQRIGLARALVVNPDLIIADEPVSALDVSIQAEILGLLLDLQAEFDLSIIVISHDMGVIEQVCDRVAVMYLGEIVEIAPTEELFADPKHPYTRALLSAIPTPDPRDRGMGVELTGDVPSPSDPPSGCRFHTRCPEIIQPADYDLERAHWRSVMNFRTQVANERLDLDALRELVAAEADAYDGPEAVPVDELAAAIREEFGVPSPLDDPRGEAVLSEAIEFVVDGDYGAASDLLAGEFSTPCERIEPELLETERGHPVACHLHDDGIASKFGLSR